MVEDTIYSTREQKEQFISEQVINTIDDCLEIIKYTEELMLESLIHFCNHKTFLTGE